VGHSKASADKIKGAERAIQALELRKSGLNYREIGGRLGISEGRAHAIVTQSLRKLVEQRNEIAEEVLRLQLERLDRMLAVLETRIAEADTMAINTALRIMEQMNTLLQLTAKDKAESALSEGMKALLGIWAAQRNAQMERPPEVLDGDYTDAAYDETVPRLAAMPGMNGDGEQDFSALDEANQIESEEFEDEDDEEALERFRQRYGVEDEEDE